jgi:phosphoribosylglycinamide formyltransferase
MLSLGTRQRLRSAATSRQADVPALHVGTAAASRLAQHSQASSSYQPSAAPTLANISSRRVAAAAHGSLPEYKLDARPPARLAVFVSGGGSNFKAIHAACLDGRINATVAAVVSDVPGCGGVTYAASHGIPTLTYPVVKKGELAGQGLTAEQLVSELKNTHKVSVCTAGTRE